MKDSNRDKLDPKTSSKKVKLVFIGYGSDDMGYHFWDESSKDKHANDSMAA